MCNLSSERESSLEAYEDRNSMFHFMLAAPECGSSPKRNIGLSAEAKPKCKEKGPEAGIRSGLRQHEGSRRGETRA